MSEDIKKRIRDLETEIEKKQKALYHLNEALNYHSEKSAKESLRKSSLKWKEINWTIALIMIPIIIFLYLIMQNFVTSHEFKTLEDFDAPSNFLSPSERINFENAGEAKVITNLAYFNVKVPNGADSFQVAMRAKDDLPKDAVVQLGAKINESWSYDYQILYDLKKNITGAKDQDHLILIANFTLNQSTYVKDGNLNMLINTNFVGKNNQTLTIDWIQIKVHKNGIFER